MRETFHGYAVSDIHTAWRHRILGAPTCAKHDGYYGRDYWARCTCEATPDIPQWVIMAWARERFGRIPRDKVSSAFRHNHANRVAPKDARLKVTRTKHQRRDDMRAMTACGRDCHDRREYMRPRMTDAEAIAEGLADAREFADMDAIADEILHERVTTQYEREVQWQRTSLCERARWMPEVDARACDCWACEEQRIDRDHEYALMLTHEPVSQLVDLMEQAPNNAPVTPVLA